MAPLTTAYAGHANVTEVNAGAIIDQFLPKDPPEGEGIGLVLIPERVTRSQSGLKNAIKWLETELGGPEKTIPVPDLIEAMLKRKEETGDDLELYLVFDPENEDDVALANAANDAGIPVRNLAGAGDFLVFEEPEDETPPFDTDEAETALAAEQVAADERSAALARTLTPAFAAGPGVRISLDLSPEAVTAIARAIVEQMAGLGAAQVAAQASSGPVAPVIPINSGGEGKPAEPMGRTDQVAGTSAYYYNAVKATYRKARGMARDDEAKLFLTEAEADEARRLKMLA